MKIIGILGILLLAYVIWQYIELQKFAVTEYKVKTTKLDQPLRLAVLADLHSHEYGKGNVRLLEEIQKQKPDVILIAGDMIVSAKVNRYPVAAAFLQELCKIAPVYLANGNHEARVDLMESPYYEAYRTYRAQIAGAGVHLLENQKEELPVAGGTLAVYGLDIPLKCYEKGHVNPLPENFLPENLGSPKKETFNILLAHNPVYIPEYTAWGCDLSLSGHMHGGLIRIPGIGSVISPQFQFFPKYDAGRFDENGGTAIISRGLGTHTFHIRIFNRAELVMVQLEPDKAGT